MIKPACVAGSFYPADRKALEAFIRKNIHSHSAKGCPKALIVPHAGYIFSGVIAAEGFSLLKNTCVDEIILIGPSHHYHFHGSTTSSLCWQTPLGVAKIRPFPGLPILEVAFENEHSLEVEVPFIQEVLPSTVISPVIVGLEEPKILAENIIRSLDDQIIIVSSDLSHFFPYDQAKKFDERTINTIISREPEGWMDACGETGVRALIYIARKMGWKGKLVCYKNSGDTVGDKSRVVGYAAIEFR